MREIWADPRRAAHEHQKFLHMLCDNVDFDVDAVAGLCVQAPCFRKYEE